ncbi:MAG TPA: hypothetical protein GX497_11190 [Bacillus bacterium]|nr:hypothetical protein [Bacillus sp. (in: firmicutes)]
MEMILNREKGKLIFVLSLVFTLLVSFSIRPLAVTTEVDSKEKAEQLAAAIYNSSNYQEDTGVFEFDEGKAISLGLDQQTARQMSVYFKGLSSDEAEALYNTQVEAGSSNQLAVAPLLVWAAEVLVAAGLTWLADKLLDYGAKKFCDSYRNYNSVTRTVCEVIAP